MLYIVIFELLNSLCAEVWEARDITCNNLDLTPFQQIETKLMMIIRQ